MESEREKTQARSRCYTLSRTAACTVYVWLAGWCATGRGKVSARTREKETEGERERGEKCTCGVYCCLLSGLMAESRVQVSWCSGLVTPLGRASMMHRDEQRERTGGERTMRLERDDATTTGTTTSAFLGCSRLYHTPRARARA